MVLMKYFQNDPTYLLNVLETISVKAPNFETVEEMCSVGETLALLKEALKLGESATADPLKKKKPPNEAAEEEHSTSADDGQNKTSRAAVECKSESTEDKLIKLCDKILTLIAVRAQKGVKDFSAKDLRRLLSIYSLLPLQADDLVNDADAEIRSRLSSLLKIRPPNSVEKYFRDAKHKSELVQQEFFQEAESSGLTAVKNGIMSLFRSTDEAESTEEKALPEALAAMIQDSINSNIEASAALQEMQDTLDVSIDSIAQRSSEGTHFELGRCQELIANYRRMEFSTGNRRSRYDKERRMVISKRVLSRLLP